jgi:hypothetical protein
MARPRQPNPVLHDRLGFAAALLAAALTGCTPTADLGICGDLCDEVYKNCEYNAYPSHQSCMEGCAYNEAEGADLEGQYACIQAAACDTFQVIECEHQFGAQSDESK